MPFLCKKTAMKRFLALSLLFSVFGNRAAAQGENHAQKAAMAKLHDYYNRQQYDSIFTLFSPEMQKALSQTKTAAFFGGLQRDRAVSFYQARRIEIRSDPPLDLQIDGEVVDLMDPLVVEVLPRALRVRVPVRLKDDEAK